MSRTTEQKTALTPDEKIIAAYLAEVSGVKHQDIAVALRVNMGRVSEAVTAVRAAVGLEPRRAPKPEGDL